jgi:transposase-like protein
MTQKRRQHSPAFKFQVALEASKGLKTTTELSQEYNIHPNRISAWKKQLKEEGPGLFQRGGHKTQRKQEQAEAELYEQIGRLKMELEWLKKKAAQFD